MSAAVFGRLSWLDVELAIAAPDPQWFEWVENFTGLDVTRLHARPSRLVLSVVDDRQVLVDDDDLRRFHGLEDLKAWLFLTVSDIMVARGGFAAFHAAGLALPGGCVLVAGPPGSGKSSWAVEAQRRGIVVLGDDQVQVDAPAGLVRALPRPLKRRLAGPWDPPLSRHAIRAHLDGEAVALEPRRTAGLAPVDRGYPVIRIVHLVRHAGAGIDVLVLPRSQALQSVLGQVRGCRPGFFLPDAAAATRMLGRAPNIRMSVGDGEIGRAIDVALNFR